MQRVKHLSNPNPKNEFAPNDMVYITERFFANHGIHHVFRQIGVGVVVSLQPPTKEALPKALVKFMYHSIFMNNETLKKLLVSDNRAKGYPSSTALIEIHPMYLEKLVIKEKGKHHGRQSKKTNQI